MSEMTATPEYSGWGPDEWAAHFRAQGPADTDDGSEELDALMAAVAAREERQAKRKANRAHAAANREVRRLRRLPHRVDALTLVPMLTPTSSTPMVIAAGPVATSSGVRFETQGGAAIETSDPIDVEGSDMILPRKARRLVRGPEDILARFAKSGVTFGLLDGKLDPITTGGSVVRELVEALRWTTPLLEPYLRDGHVDCVSCGGPAETVTLSLVPICLACCYGEALRLTDETPAAESAEDQTEDVMLAAGAA